MEQQVNKINMSITGIQPAIGNMDCKYLRQDEENNNVYFGTTVNGVLVNLIVEHDTKLTDDITRFGLEAPWSILKHHTKEIHIKGESDKTKLILIIV